MGLFVDEESGSGIFTDPGSGDPYKPDPTGSGPGYATLLRSLLSNRNYSEFFSPISDSKDFSVPTWNSEYSVEKPKNYLKL